MTLIVGIKCQDGVVLGADGAATLGVMGQSTVRQSTKKLSILHGSIALGVSGPVGLAQRIRGEIDSLWGNKRLSGKKPHEAMVAIRDALWKHVESEMKAAEAAARIIGPRAAAESAICSTIVSLPISKKLCLFQFNQQCSPEEATDDLPFVAIGSGQTLADPFLAFLRRTFWPTNLPPLGEGIFATLWTLNHAIASTPGGISDPTQIIVLEKQSNQWRARELLDEELQEHQVAITEAEQSLAKFREGFQKADKDDQSSEIPKLSS